MRAVTRTHGDPKNKMLNNIRHNLLEKVDCKVQPKSEGQILPQKVDL